MSAACIPGSTAASAAIRKPPPPPASRRCDNFTRPVYHRSNEHARVIKAVRARRYRTFTLAQIEEASADQCGFCLDCGATQENCEPDARKYRCDDCRQNEVYGAEELVLMGLMR